MSANLVLSFAIGNNGLRDPSKVDEQFDRKEQNICYPYSIQKCVHGAQHQIIRALYVIAHDLPIVVKQHIGSLNSIIHPSSSTLLYAEIEENSLVSWLVDLVRYIQPNIRDFRVLA